MATPVSGYSSRSFTVTLTNKTLGPFQLSALYTTGSTVAGTTVAPSAGYANLPTMCAMFEVQALGASGAGTLYLGDANVLTTGARQGKTLSVGDNYNPPPKSNSGNANSVNLADYYVQTDTNNFIFNVFVHYL